MFFWEIHRFPDFENPPKHHILPVFWQISKSSVAAQTQQISEKRGCVLACVWPFWGNPSISKFGKSQQTPSFTCVLATFQIIRGSPNHRNWLKYVACFGMFWDPFFPHVLPLRLPLAPPRPPPSDVPHGAPLGVPRLVVAWLAPPGSPPQFCCWPSCAVIGLSPM